MHIYELVSLVRISYLYSILINLNIYYYAIIYYDNVEV